MKRLALSGLILGTMLALQPAAASAQDRYYGHQDRYQERAYGGEHRGYDRDDYRRDFRRDEHYRGYEGREREEREWRGVGRRYYGGPVYYYGNAPSYGYGAYYSAPPCR